MTELTDKQFTATAKTIVCALMHQAQVKGLDADTTANLAGAALGEVLAQSIGPYGAVERLRDIADVMENQIMNSVQN